MSKETATGTSAAETRDLLLDAAFEHMYMHGFSGSGISEILADAGLTKGALYYHFPSKLALGYAVVEERVVPLVRERYLAPFREVSDPVEAVERMGRRMQEELLKEGILMRGCPLNNLVQEMSGIDTGFRERLAAILTEWRATVAEGIERARAKGTVHQDVQSDATATFVVASLLGAIGFAKNAQDTGPFEACRTQVNAYMATLRPDGAVTASS
ncbi:MAG TPA: TetR/AcrR family transcriptional regulator [Longimicrobiales bacterium]|nr:TetR/AcrR family transcriptional regulator [Longimicrobiales bacterium]